MGLDVRLRPKPQHQTQAISPAEPLRVYQSSLPGLVTVIVGSPGYLPRGLRLDREQVTALRDALTEHLDGAE